MNKQSEYVKDYDRFVPLAESGCKYIVCNASEVKENVQNIRDNIRSLMEKAQTSRLLGLILREAHLHYEHLKLLCEGLQDNNHLEVVELCWLGIDNRGLEFVGSVIKQNTHLLKLSIRTNQFTETSALTEPLLANTTLKYLDLGFNALKEGGVCGLAKGLEANCSLETLKLTKCHVGDAGSIALADALKVNATLLDLDLGDNCIEPTGGIALAHSLTINQTLRKLDVGYNNIQTAGGVAFAQSLTANTTLLELSFGGNNIQTAGGVAFAQSLRNNTSLRKLSLCLNSLSNEVGIAMGHALGVNGNRTLSSLSLDGNGTSEWELDGLVEALKVNGVISHISLDGLNGEYATDFIRATSDKRRQQRKLCRLNAFSEAQATSSATTPWLRSKLMVVGQGAEGKTNTVRSLLGYPFNSEWDSTVGIDLTEVATTSGAKWKRAQQKDFTSNFVHRVAAEKIEKLKAYKETVSLPEQVSESIKNTVSNAFSGSLDVLNPEDKVTVSRDAVSSIQEQVVIEKDIAEPLLQYNEELFLTEADSKDAIRMSIWDYGGQKVFYTLHHLFLTQYGVYLIVFNMAKLLDNTDESSEYLSFWLNSIKLHAPNAPVLLVGTFLDMLAGGKGQHSTSSNLKEISEILDACCSGFDQICRFGDLMYCPTSNKDRTGVQELRNTIEQVTQRADFVHTLVSLKWMRALDILSESSETPWKDVSVLKEELKDVGIEQNEELERMLCLFHELGVVLYFSSSVRLKEMVIRTPEWLLEKFSLVIRDKDIHDYDYDKQKLKEVKLTKDLDCFLEQGIASRDLLEYLWEDSQVDYLIELMRHLLLLSNWEFSKEEQYLIPSMLSDAQESRSIKGVKFCLKFTFLPHGVFERVCCLCVGYSSSLPGVAPPELYKSACVVDLGAKGRTQVYVEGSDKISVTLLQPKEANTVIDFFLSMMRRIQNEFMHNGLQWQVWVEEGDKLIKHEDALSRSLEPWVRKKNINNSISLDKFLDL